MHFHQREDADSNRIFLFYQRDNFLYNKEKLHKLEICIFKVNKQSLTDERNNIIIKL